MVLRVILKRGQGRLYDSSEEESITGSSSPQSSTEYYYGSSGAFPPPPPIINAKELNTTQPVPEVEYDFAHRLDYFLCKGGKVEHLKWPSEQQPQHASRPGPLNFSGRRMILHVVDLDRLPLPRKKSSDPQDIYQRRVPVEDLPIYNSENTAKWRATPDSTLYPDVHEKRTWISYIGRKPRRGVHYDSNHKLRNYYYVIFGV